jgi:hypothetical protein
MALPHPSFAQSECPPLKITDFPQGDLAPAGFSAGKLKKNTSYSFYSAIADFLDAAPIGLIF